MTAHTGDLQPRPRRGKPVWRIAGWLVVAALLGWIAVLVAGEMRSVEWHLPEARAWPLALAVPVLAGAYLLRAICWSVVLRRMGDGGSLAGGACIFLAAQLTRYLPGKAWPILGAGWLGARTGRSAALCAVNTAIAFGVHQVVGMTLALLVLWRFESQRVGLLTLVVVALCGLVLLPATPLPARILRRFEQWSGRDRGDVRLPRFADWTAITACSAATWVLFGVTLQLLIRGLLPALPPPTVTEATGAIAAAGAAGVLVLVAPGGLGVREAVLVALFTPTIGPAGAAMVAVAMRVWMTVVEVGLGVGGVGASEYVKRRKSE